MSDLIWYVHRNGKSLGPYSLGDLKEQVSQGILLGHDLVFREGESEWRRAFDWTELAREIYSEERTSFTRLFQLPKFDSNETQGWIALVRYEENKVMRFEQEGPYTTEKIRELLGSKKIKPSDHIWKKGYAAWVPIYLEPDFSASLWNVKDESVPLLQQVQEMPKPELPEIEVEFSAVADVVAPKSNSPMPSVVAIKPVASLAVAAKEPVRPSPRAVKKSNFQLTAFSIISLVVISSLALLYYSKKNRIFSVAQSSHLQINAVNSPPPADLVNEAPEPQAPENTGVAVIGSLPVQQEANDENLELDAEGSQASVEEPTVVKNYEPVPVGFWSFRLNTKSKVLPLLIVSGGSGRILSLPALNIRINVALNSDGAVVFDPKAHKLPPGYYRVMIYQGADIVYQEEKTYIDNLPLFQKQIVLHRKQIAFQQQQEKRKLLKTIDRTQQFVSRYKNVLSGRSSGSKDRLNVQNEYESLQVPELKAARGTKNQLMYSSGWYGLAQQLEALRGVVGAVGGRKPASRLDFDQVRKKMAVLRSQISQTSLVSEQ